MIAILGSGTMGKGIAIECARSNKKVLLISVGRKLESKDLKKEVEQVIDKYAIENKTEIIERITPTNEFHSLSECSLIIEAVYEDLEIKRNIIGRIQQYIKPTSIIASNTSSLSILEIFAGLVPLDQVIGLHFFNPVQIMKLIEVSYLDQTSDSVIEFAKEFVKSVNKEYVVVKNSPGFIVNRLLIPMINEAAKMIDEGIASPEDIDKAMKLGANHPIGPLKLSDLIGNDITLAIFRILENSLDNRVSDGLVDLVKEKKLGRKTKSGFYNY